MVLIFVSHAQVDNAGVAYVSVRSFCDIHTDTHHNGRRARELNARKGETVGTLDVLVDQIACEQTPKQTRALDFLFLQSTGRACTVARASSPDLCLVLNDFHTTT